MRGVGSSLDQGKAELRCGCLEVSLDFCCKGVVCRLEASVQKLGPATAAGRAGRRAAGRASRKGLDHIRQNFPGRRIQQLATRQLQASPSTRPLTDGILDPATLSFSTALVDLFTLPGREQAGDHCCGQAGLNFNPDKDMMELRPIQAALLAGRSASRRATANPSPLSYALAPSLYRCFSSTRPTLSEAEATAPPPTPSMQEWNRQQQQQQQPQQPEQKLRPLWHSEVNSSSLGAATGGIATLLRPNNNPPAASSSPSTPSSQPPVPLMAAPAPSPNPSLGRNPWAAPTSEALRQARERRAAADANGGGGGGGGSGKVPGLLDELHELGLLSPTGQDLMSINAAHNEPVAEVKYRLRPSVGRAVAVDSKVDLARGLGLLNLRVRVNKVAQDVSRQRFHERPGLKRKRLRRERWRGRFKEGFKATCKRVKELARQGW